MHPSSVRPAPTARPLARGSATLLAAGALAIAGCGRFANAGQDAASSNGSTATARDARADASAEAAAKAVSRAQGDPGLLASLAIDAHLSVGVPISHGVVTLFPVIDTKIPDRPEGDFDLLADALKGETFEVQELDTSGTVPTLKVKNTGVKPVLLVAGDVVQGGKQDRVLVADVLVEPGGNLVDIAVNCVESGRWRAGEAGTKFGYGGRGEATLKRTLQVEKSQGRTWETVAALNAGKAKKMLDRGLASDAAELAPSSGTYMASLENPAVKEQVDPAVRALVAGLEKQDHVVGVVVALGDSVTTAEIFGHPALFDRSRDDLVRSFVLDAVSQDIAPAQTPPKAVAAATFLKDAIASRAVGEQAAGSAVQEELDGASTRSFKTKGKDGELLHFNAYAK